VIACGQVRVTGPIDNACQDRKLIKIVPVATQRDADPEDPHFDDGPITILLFSKLHGARVEFYNFRFQRSLDRESVQKLRRQDSLAYGVKSQCHFI
jgi:hypothetical protein